MTPTEVMDTAIGLMPNYSEDYPMGRVERIMRLNMRQRDLFSIANKADREFYGMKLEVDLDRGCVDLGSLRKEQLLPEIERIDRIEVARSTGGRYAAGDQVYMVEAWDARNHPAPRVTIRSQLVEQFEDDLSSVQSITLYFARYPHTISPMGTIRGESAERDVEIGDPWEWLLVYDLVRAMLRRDTKLTDKEMEMQGAPIAELEAQLAKSYLTHVSQFAYGRQSRFASLPDPVG